MQVYPEVRILDYNICVFSFLSEIIILFFKVIVSIFTHCQQYKIAILPSSYFSAFGIVDVLFLTICQVNNVSQITGGGAWLSF